MLNETFLFSFVKTTIQNKKVLDIYIFRDKILCMVN